MTDDKITLLNTGYKPESPPHNTNDVVALQWSVVQLSEEIERLSKATAGITRVLKMVCDKLDMLVKEQV